MRHSSERIVLDIEFLRAVAILYTLIHHLPFLLFWRQAWFEEFFRGAVFWSGVDLFFCVSGFVIMRSFRVRHLDEPARLQTSFRRIVLPFWMRRAWRLWPAAWLWLVIPVIGAAWFNHSGVFGAFWPMLADAGAAFLHLANLHWIGCLFYQAGVCNTAGPLLIVYWSLSLEEQFYLLFPVLVYVVPRRYLPSVLIALIGAQFFLYRPYLTLGWAMRTDALLLGVLLALWQGTRTHRRCEPVLFRHKWLAWPCLSGALVLMSLIPSESIGPFFSTGLLAVVCGFLVWVAGYNRNYWCPGGPLRHLWVWIGSRSYALYLVHLPAFALTRELGQRFGQPGTVFDDGWLMVFLLVAMGLAASLAELTFRYVEMPLRRRGRKIAETYAAP